RAGNRESWPKHLHPVLAIRQISPQQPSPGAQAIFAGLTCVGGEPAKYALDHKLVDALASSADVEKALTKQFGWSKTENNYRALSYYDYSLKTPADTGGTIAVIVANGAIMDGHETPVNGGGDTTASQVPNHLLDHKVTTMCLHLKHP
ncbi:signal peptide peptidase SppA, partial [Salmonella enterica subsp. enterica serovar Enteritidis]|nr:signal peptide peptidase SppA [Salmonella enterica subsp. enterica serovar Enteritidis]